jgi:hypothetical protein
MNEKSVYLLTTHQSNILSALIFLAVEWLESHFLLEVILIFVFVKSTLG